MRSKLMVFAALVLMLVGAVAPLDTQVAQAGGGPSGIPWLRVYQIDPRAVGAAKIATFAIVYDTAGVGEVEEVRLCYGSSCSTFTPGFELGGYGRWGSRQSGWSWFGVNPPPDVIHPLAVMITRDGRREIISAEPVLVQPTVEASGEAWPFVDQAPRKIGDTLELRIERDLGLPVIRVEVCLAGRTWSCQYEDQKDWGLLLNGIGTQRFSLTLTHPNLSREGANGKLSGFPNGASVMARYTMVDGSSVSFLSDPMFFLP